MKITIPSKGTKLFVTRGQIVKPIYFENANSTMVSDTDKKNLEMIGLRIEDDGKGGCYLIGSIKHDCKVKSCQFNINGLEINIEFNMRLPVLNKVEKIMPILFVFALINLFYLPYSTIEEFRKLFYNKYHVLSIIFLGISTVVYLNLLKETWELVFLVKKYEKISKWFYIVLIVFSIVLFVPAMIISAESSEKNVFYVGKIEINTDLFWFSIAAFTADIVFNILVSRFVEKYLK
jgi:hypothetical protein